jgi:4-phospho-D-threonate 3-dehydrogenase / 4-phospho-D-erythronate 3-dehydrogenase
MTEENRPLIAITMGDAAGIGPEVVVKAFASGTIYRICRPLLIGSGVVIESVIGSLGCRMELHIVEKAAEVKGNEGVIDVLDLHNLTTDDFIVGKVCRSCGKASMDYIAAAADLAMRGEVAAIVTSPINKEATVVAGYGDIGHLEFLARLSHAREYATMLVTGPLRVVHLTTHYPLKEACSHVTRSRILSRLKLIQESFSRWGIPHPRIGVAALNPHGGEGGLFGREEMDEIAPAVIEAIALNIDARGPFPADTIFTRAIAGEFDVVLAMYHDQGHIPIKVHNFRDSVSVALGLPFIRTSVDHGTAFDIAGKGIADCRSLEEAVRVAVELVKGKLS